MFFIDTHCHLSDEQYGSLTDEVVQRARDKGVGIMLQPDIDSRERPGMLRVVDRYPGIVYAMAGLYPGSVDDDYQTELELAMAAASRPGIVAIGEIGLDYHEGTQFCRQQKDVLKAQLELACKLNLPVNIHLRDAVQDFVDVVESCAGLGLRGNLHAFSTSAQVFRRLLKSGDWMVGVGGVVTFKNAGLAREIQDIPLERILLETDAPYLAPTPLRGTRNEPSNIPLIASKVAQIKGVPLEEVALCTTANAREMFSLSI